MSFEQKHYTPQELGELLNVSPNTVRRVFRDQPGVLKLKCGRHTLLRIPETLAARWYDRHTRGWQEIEAGNGRV